MPARKATRRTAPSAKARGRPRSAAAEEAILRATIELLSEKGIDATTIHAVARRSGVARATIYLRWRGREELIAAALRHAIGREPVALTGDLEADIRQGAKQAQAVLSEPLLIAVLPILVRGWLTGTPLGGVVSYDALFPTVSRFGDAYRRHAAEQGFRSDVDGEAIVGMLIGGCLNVLFATGAPPSEALTQQVLNVLLAGTRSDHRA